MIGQALRYQCGWCQQWNDIGQNCICDDDITLQSQDIKALVDEAWALHDANKKKAVAKTGCVCVKCKEKNEYASPNRKNGDYVCYKCR